MLLSSCTKKQLILHAILQVDFFKVDLFLIVVKYTEHKIYQSDHFKFIIQWHEVHSQCCSTTLSVLKCGQLLQKCFEHFWN